MTSIIMAIVIASAMAIIYPGPFFAFGNELCETKITSLLEVALNDAGGKDYYVTSAGKENFFKSLNRKTIGCREKGFVASSKRYEVNYLDIEYQRDYEKTVSKEEQVKHIGEHSASGDMQVSVVNAGVHNGVKDCTQTKSGEECVTYSQYLPAKSVLQHETGFTLSDCKFEVSLNFNCDVTFRHWSLIWRWFSSSKTFTARYVLRNLEGWDQSRSTAIIYLQCEVETVFDVLKNVYMYR